MLFKIIKVLIKNLDCLNLYFLKYVLDTFKLKLPQKKINKDGVVLFDHF